MPFRAVLVLLGALVAFLGASVLSERVARADVNTQNAPLCDDRAASVYAAEPAPQPIDAGEVTQTADAGCKAMLVSGSPIESKDDLSRTPEVPHDSNLLTPPTPMMVPAAIGIDAERAISIGRPSEEHRLNDNPPPKPIPWRS
jgi:hypothetical protein